MALKVKTRTGKLGLCGTRRIERRPPALSLWFFLFCGCPALDLSSRYLGAPSPSNEAPEGLPVMQENPYQAREEQQERSDINERSVN